MAFEPDVIGAHVTNETQCIRVVADVIEREAEAVFAKAMPDASKMDDIRIAIAAGCLHHDVGSPQRRVVQKLGRLGSGGGNKVQEISA